MEFGEKILNLRKEKSLSQEQLAEKIGVTRQTISNWELEETSSNLQQLELLSKAFNISIDCLYESNSPNFNADKNNEKQSVFIIKILKICAILLISYFILRLIFIIAFIYV